MAPKYQDPYLSSVEEGLSLAHQEMLLFLWYEEVRGNIVVLIWYIFHSFTSNPSIEEDTGCFFTVPPNFQYQNEKQLAANQRFCSIEFSMYKRS